jgi:hypothetical protein
MATDVRTPASGANAWHGSFSSTVAQQNAQAIHDALVAVGLVQTADTGQIILASFTQITAANAVWGYEIWRFNDTLQATAPVFIKIEYGEGNATGTMAIWITVGTGTNGAGTLTGVIATRRQLQIQQNAGPLANTPIWTSGSASRIAQCIARQGTTPDGNCFWAVERTKDVSGVDTNEGAHIVMRTAVATGTAAGALAITFYSQTLIFSIATAQAGGSGPMCVVSNEGTATDVGNTGIFPWQMASKRGNENPPIGWLSYFFGDLAGSLDVVISVYGSNHTYRTLGAEAGQTNAQGIQRAGWRPTSTSTAITAHDSVHFAMRWE